MIEYIYIPKFVYRSWNSFGEVLSIVFPIATGGTALFALITLLICMAGAWLFTRSLWKKSGVASIKMAE